MRLDCLGSWTDSVDDVRLGAPQTLPHGAVLWSLDAIEPARKSKRAVAGQTPSAPSTVEAGVEIGADNDLLTFHAAIPGESGGSERQPVTYDFGDTKARLVNIQVQAHARFRGDFGDLSAAAAAPQSGREAGSASG